MSSKKVRILATHNHPSPQPRVSPTLAICLAILAVSTAAILIRFAQQEVSSITIAAYRMGIAALILIPLFIAANRRHPVHLDGKQGFWLTLSGVFLALHFATWNTSLAYTSVASSVVLVTTTPVWVALLSPVLLHESLDRRALIGMLLALAGGALIALSDVCQFSTSGVACPALSGFFSGRAVWGDFLALIGAWMAGGYLMIGRKLRANLSLLSYTTIVYGVAAVLLFLMAGLMRQPLGGFSASAWLWLVALAIIPQLFGHSTFNWALKHVPAGYVSIFLLGEPVGSTILAVIFLDEIPGMAKIIGAVTIMIGIWLTSLESSNKN